MSDPKKQPPSRKPLVLMILDGWGYREAAPDNAISQAHTPCWDELCRSGVMTCIETSGEAVGLPAGQMGNSEVGHMNIGAGRVVYQDYTRVSKAIESGSFAENPALRKAIAASRERQSTLHIMGLLSPGGVHSHQEHFLAMVALAAEHGAHRIMVHAFLDGRDTPPRSAETPIREMQNLLDRHDNAAFGTLTGRYYAMDRDQRWDRVNKAWLALVDGVGAQQADSALQGLDAAYRRDESDEFVSPTVIADYQGVRDDDAVVFVNFRADRAREITRAFCEPGFTGFPLERPELAAFVCMTQYLEDLPVDIAFPPEKLEGLLGECLSDNGLRQLRIAETEKYAHVTFFFNGGDETPFPDEKRLLIPSPDVATYDLQPEMNAARLSDELDQAIRSGDFDVIICNVANPDMVGHTGSMTAAIAAVEAVDRCLEITLRAVQSVQGDLLITADHGNVEQMTDPHTGQAHTAHTTNPVPFVYVGSNADIASGGALEDIAPTMLYLLGLSPPPQMTGRSLLKAEPARMTGS